MSFSQHWIDLVPGASPGVQDRAFLYGDSLFETMRFCRGSMHWLDLHLHRMQRGCGRLDIPYPAEAIAQHLALATAWLSESAVEEACLRLTLSRGESARGYAGQPDQAVLALHISDVALPWGQVAPPLNVEFCQIRLSSQPVLAGIKHGNRLEQVMAARELRERGAVEGVLLNQRGELVSGVSSNLFMVTDDALVTPVLDECGVAGTVRQLIIEQLAAQAGMSVREQPLQSADVSQAEEMFLTNALFGIRSVSACAGHRFTSTRRSDNLRALFMERSDPCSQ